VSTDAREDQDPSRRCYRGPLAVRPCITSTPSHYHSRLIGRRSLVVVDDLGDQFNEQHYDHECQKEQLEFHPMDLAACRAFTSLLLVISATQVSRFANCARKALG
jgi:hypothetical protein